MSLPGNAISTTPVLSNAVYPDGIERNDPTVDYEFGGVALNDPSQGYLVKVWRCWTDGESVWVAPSDNPHNPTLVLTDARITEVALAFDQNMAVTIAYVAGGLVKLRWFDTLTSGFTTTTYPNCYSPMLTLDDKREGQSGTSDVLFFYVRDNKLCYRQQRDRYGVERVLQNVPSNDTRIVSLGMNQGGRVQAKLKSPYTAAHVALEDDSLLVVSRTDVVKLHASIQHTTAIWRSRVYVFDSQPSFSWIRVEGATPETPITVRVFGDTDFFHQVTLSSHRATRIPARNCREWYVEIEAPFRVVEVALATSSEQMGAL